MADQVSPPDDSADPDDLMVNVRARGDDVIVSVAGELDVATVDILRDALEAALPDSGSGSGGDRRAALIFDLRQTGFIDSAGLALLVVARKRWGAARRIVLIVGRDSQPERVLTLGRFQMFLNIVARDYGDAADIDTFLPEGSGGG